MFGLLISINLLTKWGSHFGPFQDLFAPLETSTNHFFVGFCAKFQDLIMFTHICLSRSDLMTP